MNPPTYFPAWLFAAGLLAALCGALISLLVTNHDDGSTGGGLAFASTAPPDEVFERAVAIAEPSVVQIETDKGLGSGVVLDHHGDIVTNAHVVAGASSFVVTDDLRRRHPPTFRGAFAPDHVAELR